MSELRFDGHDAIVEVADTGEHRIVYNGLAERSATLLIGKMNQLAEANAMIGYQKQRIARLEAALLEKAEHIDALAALLSEKS